MMVMIMMMMLNSLIVLSLKCSNEDLICEKIIMGTYFFFCRKCKGMKSGIVQYPPFQKVGVGPTAVRSGRREHEDPAKLAVSVLWCVARIADRDFHSNYSTHIVYWFFSIDEKLRDFRIVPKNADILLFYMPWHSSGKVQRGKIGNPDTYNQRFAGWKRIDNFLRHTGIRILTAEA